MKFTVKIYLEVEMAYVEWNGNSVIMSQLRTRFRQAHYYHPTAGQIARTLALPIFVISPAPFSNSISSLPRFDLNFLYQSSNRRQFLSILSPLSIDPLRSVYQIIGLGFLISLDLRKISSIRNSLV